MGPSPAILMPTPDETAPEGRGRGRGRVQECRRGCRKTENKGGKGTGGAMSTNFKGRITKLGGHMFQVFHKSENKNQFTRTVEALSKYFTKQMKYGGHHAPHQRFKGTRANGTGCNQFDGD